MRTKVQRNQSWANTCSRSKSRIYKKWSCNQGESWKIKSAIYINCKSSEVQAQNFRITKVQICRSWNCDAASRPIWGRSMKWNEQSNGRISDANEGGFRPIKADFATIIVLGYIFLAGAVWYEWLEIGLPATLQRSNYRKDSPQQYVEIWIFSDIIEEIMENGA